MEPGLPWFGPKKGIGWGWTPVTWQGWLISAVFLAVFLALCYAPPSRHRLVLLIATLAIFLGVVVATGTKPGGSWR